MTDDELIGRLCEIEAGLTAWEVDRIEEWARLVEAGGELTERQREVCEEILRRLER